MGDIVACQKSHSKTMDVTAQLQLLKKNNN